MDRVNGADFIDIGGGRRGFVGEDLLIGIPGTEITDDWLNAVQEEILSVIEDAGLEADPEDNTQLLQALERRETARTIPFIPVVAVDVAAPPGAPGLAQTYLIPPGATGVWAGRQQQLAQWNGLAWRYLNAPNGHVIGTPDGTQYTKIGGVYSAFQTQFNRLYSYFVGQF